MKIRLFDVEDITDDFFDDEPNSWSVYAGYTIGRNGGKNHEYVWIERYEDGTFQVENERGNNIGGRKYKSFESAYQKAKEIIRRYVDKGIYKTDEPINEGRRPIRESFDEEIIDELEYYLTMHNSKEGSIEIWSKDAKNVILDWFKKNGYKYEVSGNDRADTFSYHVEYWK